jgi:HK97 family phage portal protein
MSGHILAARGGGNVELRGANPYQEFGSTAPPPPGSVGGNIGGLGVTTESATQIAAVYGCVGLLADSVSSLPIRVLDKPATVNTAKELHLPTWLERPYEPISLTDWIVCFVWSLALRGNFIGWIVERDKKLGYPTQIMPVNPDEVGVRAKPENGELEWRFAGKLVPTEDVFHVRYQSMPGQILGLNPIQIMRFPLGLAHVLDVHAEKYFTNSAKPDGVIQVPGQLSDSAIRQMSADWASKHQGVQQSSLPGFLTEGAEWKEISITPADQQLLESRKFGQEEIAGIIFRIPPHMLGLNERSTSFGRGIEQQERTFVQNTLSGYLTRASRSLTECLPRGQYVDFDIRHRIRGDSLQRAEVAYKMVLCGSFFPDDARELFDMPPLPNGEGKILHAPTNAELLQMQLEELKKLEAAPDVPPPPTVVAPPANGHGPSQNVPVPTK